MKAIRVSEFGDADRLRLEEIEKPVPGPGQVLVRVMAAGVNPVDTYIRSGTHSVRPDLPYTPGKDAAGIIEAVGEGVAIPLGTRVYTADSLTGTYAEFCLCNEEQVHALGEGISFEQGAGIFVPYATAYRALFQKAQAKAGETVLIHGASGAVGIAAIQFARRAGLRVIGTAGSEAGIELIKNTGADFAFNHSAEGHLGEILGATDGSGVDIILEMLANENLEKDFGVLAKFGRIVVIGNRGSLEFTPRLAMAKDASIHGMVLFNASKEEMEQIYAAIAEGMDCGVIDPVVESQFRLEDAADAHRAVISRKALGKIVLIP
jgi:NADPH2:quinone reductase